MECIGNEPVTGESWPSHPTKFHAMFEKIVEADIEAARSVGVDIGPQPNEAYYVELTSVGELEASLKARQATQAAQSSAASLEGSRSGKKVSGWFRDFLST